MIKTNITDTELLTQIENLPQDCRQIMLLSNGQIRLTAISGTTAINQMRANHKLGILETYILGQAYIATGLITSCIKGNDRIQLCVECGGKIGGIYTEAWACGAVRGYLKNNPIQITEPLTSWDLNKLFGPGFLSISKIIEGSRTPFTGQIMMEHGDLAKDLALYYSQSEQTPTMFNLSVYFDKQGRVTGAGGLFLQAMPNCSEQILDDLQKKCMSLPPLGKLLSEGMDIKQYCTENFADYSVQPLSNEIFGFSCPCCKENYKIFLQNLPKDEKQAIIDSKQFPLELECFNCGSRYTFSENEIQQLFGEQK